MFNNGNIWTAPGLNRTQWVGMHRATFGAMPVGDVTQMSQGGTCTNCGGSGRIIYTNPDGSLGDMGCPACMGSGQNSL